MDAMDLVRLLTPKGIASHNQRLGPNVIKRLSAQRLPEMVATNTQTELFPETREFPMTTTRPRMCRESLSDATPGALQLTPPWSDFDLPSDLVCLTDECQFDILFAALQNLTYA
jgi:hypothetical protein